MLQCFPRDLGSGHSLALADGLVAVSTTTSAPVVYQRASGVGDGSVGKVITDPQHLPEKHGSTGGDGQVPHWPASLAELLSSRFIERLSQKTGWRTMEVDL